MSVHVCVHVCARVCVYVVHVFLHVVLALDVLGSDAKLTKCDLSVCVANRKVLHWMIMIQSLKVSQGPIAITTTTTTHATAGLYTAGPIRKKRRFNE